MKLTDEEKLAGKDYEIGQEMAARGEAIYCQDCNEFQGGFCQGTSAYGNEPFPGFCPNYDDGVDYDF
jgi:hypothetical protein